MEGVGRHFFGTVAALEKEAEVVYRVGNRAELLDRIARVYNEVLENQFDLGDDAFLLTDRLSMLQTRLEGGRPAVAKVSVQVVRNTFHNLMAEIALEMPAVNSETLLPITAVAVIRAIELSKNVNGILAETGEEVTEKNCPAEFQPLLMIVIANKGRITSLEPAVLARVKALIVANGALGDSPELVALSGELLGLAAVIKAQPQFAEIGQKILEFADVSVDVAPEQLEGVTEELVRDSFYIMMYEHALATELITAEALREQEPYIYFALSHHALLESMLQSKRLKGAIALKDNKAITLNNCPEVYKPLAEVIFAFKSAVCKMTPDQLTVLKAHDNPDIKLDAHLEQLKTRELLTVAASIYRVAQNISELPTFKAIIARVVEFILGSKKE